MKKLFMLAALVLGMASCQTEPEGLDVVVGGEQEVMLNVSLPESTRSSSSTGFDFTNFESNGSYDLRFILEIRHNDNVVRTVKVTNTTSMTFPVRLAPNRDYTFTVWADLVEEGKDVDLYYNTEDLSNITFKSWTPNIETRDAYTKTMTKTFVAGTDLSMELTRPFAKVRVVATDIKNVRDFEIEPTNAIVKYNTELFTSFNAVEDCVNSTETVKKTHSFNYADVDTYTDVEGQFTAFADYIFVPASGTIQFSLEIKQNNDTIKESKFNTAIPVEENKITSIVGDILTDGGNVSITVDSVLGEKETINFVNSAASLQKAINDITEGKGGNIKLGGDVDLNDMLNAGILATTRTEKQYGVEIPAGKSVVLDLNGKKIFQTKECRANYAMIVNKGNLTIVDGSETPGKISFKDTGAGDPNYGWGSYTIRNEGTLVVENGTIEHLGEQTAHMICAIFQYSGSSTIYGGTISTPAYRSARLWGGDMTINGGNFEGQLWLQSVNNTSSDLTINGGTFAPRGGDNSSVYVTNNQGDVTFAVTGGHFTTKIGMYQPFGCITGGTFTEAAKANTNEALIAEGYQFVQGEDSWNVAKAYNVNDTVATLYYGDGLKNLIDSNNTCNKAILANDITVNELLAVNKEFTIDLNGHTLTGVNAISDKNNDGKITSADNAYLFDVRGNLTVKNGTIKFKHTGDNFGWNACSDAFYVAENGTLNVIDATVENLGGTDMAYAIDLVNAKENLNLNITNSTIKSSYIPVRVFNNAAGVNNVNIENSTIEGVSRALWVHVYSSKDNGGKGYKDATLNLNIFGNGNTYKASNEYRLIEFGFDDVINFDGEGNLVVRDESALEYAFTKGIDAIVGADVVTVTKPLSVGKGKNVTLDLNDKSVVGESSTTGKNYDMIDVRGNLTVKNGTITCEFKGENMGWSASTNVFNITDGGVVELEGVTAKNLGGSDMAFVAHLNNWGEATLNATNSTFESTYIAIRAFNSGYDMNNISIRNSTLKGKYCFWVHNYQGAGDAVGTDETLNLDIINGTNIFEYSSKAPILYGFNEPLYFDAKGSPMIFDAAGLTAAIKAGGECTLGADIVMTESVAISDANFTLDGNGKTITMAEGATNTYALFDITRGKAAIKNITFDGIRSGAVVRTVGVEFTAENVTAKNGQHTQQQGLFRLIGKSTIKDCEFTNNTCSMVITLNYDGANSDPQVIENCLFEGNTCNGTAAVYYVKGAGATINGNKFIGNTVNCSSNGATVYMGFTEDNVVTNNLFQNNTVNEADTSSRVAGGVFFGYEAEFTGNAFVGNSVTGSNAKANDVCVSTYYTNIDLSGNYWGGDAPVEDVNYFVQHKSDVRVVIINDYLTENPIK